MRGVRRNAAFGFAARRDRIEVMSDPSDRRPPPLFRARITPNASLTRKGFLAVMALVVVVNFAAGAMFFAKGAWPVLPFLGLDVLLIWLAFRAYGVKSRAFEEVELTETDLVVHRVAWNGAHQAYRFEPYWTRLARDMASEEGLERLSLVSHGRALVIAHALSPPERARFADALEAALRGWRARSPQPD